MGRYPKDDLCTQIGFSVLTPGPVALLWFTRILRQVSLIDAHVKGALNIIMITGDPFGTRAGKPWYDPQPTRIQLHGTQFAQPYQKKVSKPLRQGSQTPV